MTKPAVHAGPGFRFSARTLLLSVVPISFGVVAIQHPTYAWAAAATTATLLAIPAAIVAAIFDIRRRRPVWLGFSIFAGGYSLLLLTPAWPYGPPLLDQLGTEQLNRWLIEKIQPGADYPGDYEGPYVTSEWRPADRNERRMAASAPRRTPVRLASSFASARRPADAAMLFDLADPAGNPSAQPNSASDVTPTSTDPDAPADPTIAANRDSTTADDPSGGEKPYEVGESFKEIARSLWIWCFGVCGACLASYLAGRNTADGQGIDAAPDGVCAKASKWVRLRAGTIRAATLAALLAGGGYVIWNPSDAPTLVVLSAVATGLVGISICAVFGSPRRRPFRVGFAVFCGGYLLLFCFVGWMRELEIGATWFLNSSATSRLLYYLYDQRFPNAYRPSNFPDGIREFHREGGVPVVGFNEQVAKPVAAPGSDGGLPDHASVGDRRTQLWQLRDPALADSPASDEPFVDSSQDIWITGQSVWAILLGMLGGALAEALARRRLRNLHSNSPGPTPAAIGAFDAVT